ncbi:MAG: SDR family NAD(P)-dependent oxidoreductase [Pseudohongiellaceae bacterium]
MTSGTQQIIWITGASSGIGEALASRLGSQGHKVIISGRSRDRLEQFKRRHQGDFIALPVDVGNDLQMQHAAHELDTMVSHLDIIILCAGQCEYIDLPDLNLASMRRVMDSNFFGVANACAAALPLLYRAHQHRPAAKPLIIGLSSMSCYLGFPRAQGYGSSKAAMAYFLNSMRADLQPDIDVTVVFPGFVETPMTSANDFPMPTMVSVEYAADYILRKIPGHPRSIAFPARLHWILKLASVMPKLWYSVLAPRLSRARRNGL